MENENETTINVDGMQLILRPAVDSNIVKEVMYRTPVKGGVLIIHVEHYAMQWRIQAFIYTEKELEEIEVNGDTINQTRTKSEAESIISMILSSMRN
jgi:hypothetical protein